MPMSATNSRATALPCATITPSVRAMVGGSRSGATDVVCVLVIPESVAICGAVSLAAYSFAAQSLAGRDMRIQLLANVGHDGLEPVPLEHAWGQTTSLPTRGICW